MSFKAYFLIAVLIASAQLAAGTQRFKAKQLTLSSNEKKHITTNEFANKFQGKVAPLDTSLLQTAQSDNAETSGASNNSEESTTQASTSNTEQQAATIDVTALAISCDSQNTDNLAVISVCKQCSATYAYNLTSNNSEAIGTAYNSSTQLANLISILEADFSDEQFTIAFGTDTICLASANLSGNYTIDQLLTATGISAAANELPRTVLFDPSSSITPTLLELIYSSTNDEFTSLKTYFAYDYTIEASSITLEIKQGVYSADDSEILFSGAASSSDKVISANFTLDYTLAGYENETLAAKVDLSSNPILVSKALNEFVGTTLSDLVNVTISKDLLGDLNDFYISYAGIQVLPGTNSTSVGTYLFIFSTIPDFALTPEISVTNPDAYLLVESSSSGELVIEGSAVSSSTTASSESSFLQVQASGSFSASFLYTQSLSGHNLTITPNSSITFAQLYSFLVGSAQGVETSSTGFFPDETVFSAVDLTDFTISNPIITILTFPNPAYYLTGSIANNAGSSNGTVSFLTANLGGYQSSFLYLDLTAGELGLLAKNLLDSDEYTSDFAAFNEVVDSESLKISIASREIDFSTYSDLSSFSPSNTSNWTYGVSVSYSFSLKSECNGLAFCTFLTENYGSDTVYQLTGAVDEDVLDLSSDLSVVDLDALVMSIQSLGLHIQLSQELEIYLKVVGSLGLPPNSTVTVTGNLDLSKNGSSFNGTTKGAWENVLDQSSINMYNLAVFSASPAESVSSLLMQGAGAIIFGTSCFGENEQGTEEYQNSTCIYGNANIYFEYKNSSLAMVKGHFESLSQSQLLSSIAGFDASFIESNVSSVGKRIALTSPIRFYFATESSSGSTNLALAQMQQTEVSEEETSEQPSYYEEVAAAAVGNASETTGEIIIVANATFLEIISPATITFNPTAQTVVEELQFLTAEVAFGNIAIFSDDTENPNTITVSISEASASTGQVSVKAQHVNVFNYTFDGAVDLDDESVSLSGNLALASNLDFIVTGSGNYTDSLNSSKLDLTITLDSSSFSVIEEYVKSKVSTWLSDFIANITSYQALVDYYKAKLSSETETLCSADECPLIPSCTVAPYEKCVKYGTKKNCKRTESYCANTSTVCNATVQKCILMQKVCVAGTSENYCKTVCTEYVDICVKYDYICTGGVTDTCVDYDTDVDDTNCTETALTCDEVVAKDSLCVQICNAGQYRYNNMSNDLNTLTAALNQIITTTGGIYTFNQLLNTSNGTLFELGYWKLEKTLEEKINSAEIKWDIQFVVELTETSRTYSTTVSGVDLNSLESVGDSVYEQFMIWVGDQYSFNATDMLSEKYFDDVEESLASLLSY